MGPGETHHLPARAVTGGAHHFFGYYDKCPWSADGSRILAMRAAFMDRPPRVEDVLVLGFVDVQTGAFHEFAETAAWCWQQGTMLQWLPSGDVIYNARAADGSLIAAIQDVDGGGRRELPLPVYCVGADGREAAALNYHRVQLTRPGYGYPPGMEMTSERFAPDDDGLWRMDIETGESELVLSLARAAAFQPTDDMEDTHHWFNHITFNPDGSRLSILHRWKKPDRGWTTRLLTVNPDGSDLFLLNANEMTSHYVWRDGRRFLAWANQPAPSGDGYRARYYLFTDKTSEVQTIGEGVLTKDGHMTYSPDRAWLLSDEYPSPEDRKRPLLLYHIESDRRIEVGRFYAPPEIDGETRCDLHPRWNRDGTQVCFDSAHEGSRQVYVMDVSEVVGG